MTELEYEKIKKAYVAKAKVGDLNALKALSILEKTYTDQLNNEQIRDLKDRDQSLKENAALDKKRVDEAKAKTDAEELDRKHQFENEDREMAKLAAIEEKKRQKIRDRLEKQEKFWSIFGPIFGAFIGAGATVGVAAMNNRHKDKVIDQVTKFETDGTPTSLAAKTVITEELKKN